MLTATRELRRSFQICAPNVTTRSLCPRHWEDVFQFFPCTLEPSELPPLPLFCLSLKVLLSEFHFQAHHVTPESLALCPASRNHKEKLGGKTSLDGLLPAASLPWAPSFLCLLVMAPSQAAADLTNLFGMVHSTIFDLSSPGSCTLNTAIWGRPVNEEVAESTLAEKDPEGLLASHHMHNGVRELETSWQAFHFPSSFVSTRRMSF